MTILFKIFILYFLQHGTGIFKSVADTNLVPSEQATFIEPAKNISLHLRSEYEALQTIIGVCLAEDPGCDIQTMQTEASIVFSKLDYVKRSRIMKRVSSMQSGQRQLSFQWTVL